MLFHSDQENNPPEAADLQAAQRGDRQAFGRLVQAQQAFIYTLSYRVFGDEQTALEAAQSGIRQAAAHLASFRSGQFQLWLLRWVVTACREHLPTAVAKPATDSQTHEADSAKGLQRGLCCLPFNLRLALILVDVSGLDYGQAAVVLGAPREQVGLWLAQARARLITG